MTSASSSIVSHTMEVTYAIWALGFSLIKRKQWKYLSLLFIVKIKWDNNMQKGQFKN